MVKLPKGDDAFRIIAIPTVRDRLVQRVVLHYFSKRPKLSPATEISYGSISGRGVNNALKAAVKFRDEAPIALQTDITKFFDTIDRSKLKKSIPTTICKSVREIILKAIDCEIKTRDSEDSNILYKNEIVTGRGLRQGMPLSPLLSNFFLKKFDSWLLKNETRCVRYVDDICVFKNTEKECLQLLGEMKEKLLKLKLNIPEIEAATKTNIHHKTDVVELLGVEIRYTQKGYGIYPQTKKLPKIQLEFEKIGTVKFCVDNKYTMHRLMQRLDSMADGYRHSLRNVEGTRDYLNTIDSFKDKQKAAFLVEFFGEFLNSLDASGRAILGLDPFSSTQKR
nr:reverse transcriptase domain-containing protein [Asticcacaulis machinosus]